MATWKATVVVGLLTLFGATFASPDRWQRFVSSDGFVVMYPTSWFRHGISKDGLQLSSAPQGAEGVIVAPGVSVITVIEPPDSAEHTLADVVRYYAQGVPILSQHDVPVVARRHGCDRLTEVRSKAPVIPPEYAAQKVPIVSYADFICEVEGRRVVTLEQNFEGEPRQAYFLQVALEMARTTEVFAMRPSEGKPR